MALLFRRPRRVPSSLRDAPTQSTGAETVPLLWSPRRSSVLREVVPYRHCFSEDSEAVPRPTLFHRSTEQGHSAVGCRRVFETHQHKARRRTNTKTETHQHKDGMVRLEDSTAPYNLPRSNKSMALLFR